MSDGEKAVWLILIMFLVFMLVAGAFGALASDDTSLEDQCRDMGQYLIRVDSGWGCIDQDQVTLIDE